MTAAAYPGQGSVTTARNRGTMRGLVGANQKIPAGAWCAIVGGYWVNVTAATGLEGRVAKCLKDVDNTGGANGATSIDVQLPGNRNLELIANDDLAPVAATDLGSDVFWLDNATVSLDDNGGTRSRAGRAWAFYQAAMSAADTTRVWVELDAP
jgi:hypothetical protein